jgi:hypothetical protein
METRARVSQLDDADALIHEFDLEFERVREALNLLTAKS